MDPAASPRKNNIRHASKRPKRSLNDTVARGEATGKVNFPPYEVECPELLEAYKAYDIQPGGECAPFGSIDALPSCIPYSNKNFLEKTGRKDLRLYSYSFVPSPQIDRQKVMWDYTNGLMKITPFFKSLEMKKNDPKKSIDANPGLSDLSHNITGGRIEAQGYWVPFDAAKAIAASFCHPIRWALVPIFGPDFPKSCILPGTPGYKSYRIDTAIIERAKAQAEMFRNMSCSLSPTTPPARQSRMELPSSCQDGPVSSPEAQKEGACTRNQSTFPMTPTSPNAGTIDLRPEDQISPFSQSNGRPTLPDLTKFRPLRLTPSASPPVQGWSRNLGIIEFTAADRPHPPSALRTPDEVEAALALVDLSEGLWDRKRKATEMD
ncbi:DNA topoisomerase 2 [Ascosphaera pollenicola]|nr:DNA topoisomerase 2 [Ascosphaera pollenicola]